VGAISIVLVVTAIGLAIYLSATEEEEEEGGGEHAALVLPG
jgi:membrane protein involved in colicin uptake